MKRILLLSLIFGFGCSSSETEQASKPPNVILIISDDQGWSDYSFMGHPAIRTPHIDQLAEESLTFTRGYVAAPLCCPSLATIITGLYPHQHGVTGNDPAFEFQGKRYGPEWQRERMERFRPLIDRFNRQGLLSKYLSRLDYLSIQTGKWWMGSWEEAGFTHGMTHGDVERGGRHGDDGLSIGREGLQPIYNLIDQARDQNRPFFVWYAPFLPHSPHTPPSELEDKYLEVAPTPAIAKYWAMCEWFDQTCGDLLTYVDDSGLTDETMVIYVCDNGWIQDADRVNRYAPRSKRTPYEMGLRTPMMFKWPGHISSRKDTVTLVSSIDIVPTVLAACGLEPDDALPGVNVLEAPQLNSRKMIFAEALAHDIADIDQPAQSLQYRVAIDYPWKLILPDTVNLKNREPELFNVSVDPHEKISLTSEHPDVVHRMKELLDLWWTPRYDNKDR